MALSNLRMENIFHCEMKLTNKQYNVFKPCVQLQTPKGVSKNSYLIIPEVINEEIKRHVCNLGM